MSDPTQPTPDPSQPNAAPEAEQPTTALPASEQAPAQPAPAFPEAPAAPQAAPAYPLAPAYAAAPPAPPLDGQPAGAPYQGAPYQGAPQQAPLNTLSVIALVGGILFNIVGIICGHIALSQIKRTGERGRGLALAGTIIGYVSLAISVIATISLIVFAGAAASIASDSISQSQSSLEELESSLPDTSDLDSDDSGLLPESETADLPRSAEFCAALEDLTALAEESTSAESMDAMLAAYTKLGSIDSPNRAVYEEFAKLAADPTSVTPDEELMSGFTTAMFEDAMACM
ncbi:DUF4190 domain-containing protein [Leucobacter luti]|uniref:Uncharacterized protein DUF4190 n=1 Tax=Leucobacter luti TaxID=340320 RepID=A0A4Q7U7V5_9MICO|nr:DUF4190 domain-containing protein [Leucobacter luti]MBL3700902.1 DUF4190 domain-containing protein [Leucobacter luti]RZT68880.1 uncharacterized protein DUF4190 [Leucobacter luti]